ncbi:MAG: Maf family protein [Rhodothermia bacterium]|nr:MAG: Maf family protein [Rhodothermia bacterium]
MKLKIPLILASGSPRRKQILEALHIPFDVQMANIEEAHLPGEHPAEMVVRLAQMKAQAVSSMRKSALVLAADTTVQLDEELLGKPADKADSIQMLQRLSGRSHTVLTGIALLHNESMRASTAFESTLVTFDDIGEDEIVDYVDTGTTLDKAGSYGIQDDRGALFISRIEGDFFNVMGLPLNRLYRLLKTDFGDLIVRKG